MELFLNGKIILVAGSAGSFCNELSAALTIEGAIPVWFDSSNHKKPAAFGKEQETHGAVVAIKVNGNEHTLCKEAIEKIVEKFGRIDGLVNCPDMGDPANPDENNREVFHQRLHNHLLDYFLTARHALPALKNSNGPILNVVIDPAGKDETHNILQTAINSGYHALTREWAVELLANGIRVNAVCAPSHEGLQDGLINTILFLLSSRSSHTTGQLIYTG